MIDDYRYTGTGSLNWRDTESKEWIFYLDNRRSNNKVLNLLDHLNFTNLITE